MQLNSKSFLCVTYPLTYTHTLTEMNYSSYQGVAFFKSVSIYRIIQLSTVSQCIINRNMGLAGLTKIIIKIKEGVKK